MQSIDLTLGTPFPKLFPSKLIAGAVQRLYEGRHFERILGYGASVNGDLGLREQIIRLRPEYSAFTSDDILITFGSTDAIDLFFRNTLVSGDVVVVENPTYKWAVKDILRCGGRIVTVPMDADGMQVEALENLLENDGSLAAKIKSVYSIPTLHNPTGVSMSEPRRKLLVRLAKKYDFLILEDDPYYEFVVEDRRSPSLLDIDADDRVVQICTFSKLMAPGLRLGWMATRNPIISDISSRKHNASNPFLSSVVSELLKMDDYWAHLGHAREYYRHSLEIFIGLIENRPGGFEYFAPAAGFYILLRLPSGVDEGAFVEECGRRGVKVMAAGDFFPGKTNVGTIRLSFASVSHDDLRSACSVLSAVLGVVTNDGDRRIRSAGHVG